MSPKLTKRILIVEDEKNIARGMSYNLERRGYEVELAERGDHGLELAMSKDFDLIILDVMLPELNGFDVCQRLREADIHTPILMLTARNETENRIKGISLGADDYLAKPFDLGELIARVAALLRRRDWDQKPRIIEPFFLKSDESGVIEFDARGLKLCNNDKHVSLTAIESRLLQELVTEVGHPVPRAQLLKKVWGLHKDTQTRTLDNFIMRLRHHLESVGGSGEWIESVRGVGYRLKAAGKTDERSKSPTGSQV